MPLSDTYIRSLKAADKEQKHFDGGGLYLSIPKTGKKLWRMAYRFNQKTKLLSFGEHPIVSLKDARERREETKKMLANGIDPGAQKKAAREEQLSEIKDTFQSVALEWYETRTTDFTEKHRGTVMYRIEKYIFPLIGSEHIARMEAPEILAVVKPLEHKGQNETARRILQIISQVYRYAVITGRLKRNPATDLHGALRPRKVTHRAALTEPNKVAQLLRDCDSYEGYLPIVCALRLAPLVFTRPTELRAAEWSEFDLASAEWRIPAQRMKMKQMHIVPLSKQAVKILEEVQVLPAWLCGAAYSLPSEAQRQRQGKMPSKKLRITMYVTQEEHSHISASADRTNRSLSNFCKLVSMGYNVPGLEHVKLRLELRGLRGDLGKLGGLVKLALSEGADRHIVHRMLHELDKRQKEVQEAVNRVA